MRYPFLPKDVDLSSHLAGTFGKSEVEESACNLVAFCQFIRGWAGFRLEEFDNFVKRLHMSPEKLSNSKHYLFGLIGQWNDDGGIGYIREAPVQALICNGYDWEVSLEFLERIKKHVKVKVA